MSGSASSPPNFQGLGIISQPESGHTTPSSGNGNNPFISGSVSGINNPRVRGQMNQATLHQQQMQQQQQQMQHIQRQRQIQQQQQQARHQQMQAQQAGLSEQDPFSLQLHGMSVDPSMQHLLSTGEATNPTSYRIQQGMPNPFPSQMGTGHEGKATEEEQQEDEDLFETNTFFLEIKSPLTITGDNNLVTFHPAPQVKNIAEAVLKALASVTEGQRGIPMGDAEANPRGIRMGVSAAVTINGQHNIVGEEAVKAWAFKVGREAAAQGNLQARNIQLSQGQNQGQKQQFAQAQQYTQAQAQAQGQGQGDQGPQSSAQLIDSMTPVQREYFAHQVQRVRGQSQSNAQAQTQKIQAQQAAQIQQQQQAQLQTSSQQQTRLANIAPKDGKRPREPSGSQTGGDANKKSKTDG